jgi:spermidine synthase
VDSSLWLWSGIVLLIVSLLVSTGKRQHEPYVWIYVLFFFSGFPALIYQIVWQRALFAIYGVNIESVTVVVTAFMLGLGLGSLMGGWLSQRKGVPLLLLFGFMELGIAAYGLISLHLFHWIATFTAGTTIFKTSILAFLLVLVPTLLMGGTLPLLVAQLVPLSKNVGSSLGKLYFVNTLGSALACFISADILMRSLGQSGSVVVAASVNVSIGLLVLFLSRHFRKAVPKDSQPASEPSNLNLPSARLLVFPMAVGIAAVAGFISLGYEIMWYRVFSFTTGSMAMSFATLLGSYLAGIAVGSWAAEGLCKRYLPAARHWVPLIGAFVVAANLVGFLVVPFLAYMSRWLGYGATLPLVGLAAALLGAVLPLIAHASIRPDSSSGAKLSYLYLSNIIGSAAGSFVVGFILTDTWPLPRIVLFLALLGILLGSTLLLSNISKRNILASACCCAVAALTVVTIAGPGFHNVYDKLCFKKAWSLQLSQNRFERIVETRNGVVAVTTNGLVYGDGSLEARLSTDPKEGVNFNFLVPPFALSSFHSSPKKILMIGLGTGAWAEIIANHPQVEKLRIVEINAGYLQIIRAYSQVSGLLNNPKVEIMIDDARRWLLRNPEEKFDAVIMNTRHHRREHVSSLLSVEFLQLLRRHLNPQGIFLYNTTNSARALLTGVSVFPYGVRIRNCLVVSDSPIEVDDKRWKNSLLEYRLDDRPVFSIEIARDQAALSKVLSVADFHSASEWEGMAYAADIRRKYRGLSIITDDNMGDEWLH